MTPPTKPCAAARAGLKALAAVRLLRARGVDVKLNGSVTPENVGEMDRLYAIARQLDVPMHMDAYMMPGGAGATALTERTAGTAIPGRGGPPG